MPAHPVPLAHLSPVYRRSAKRVEGEAEMFRRLALWVGGGLIAAGLYFGVPAFWNWPHYISPSGGLYFAHRMELAVPAFQQNDPRWSLELLGPTYDTIGQTGCAITSASMVLSAYGVDTDPQRLNQYLNTHDGYTPQGWVYWEKAAEVAPYSQVEKAYEDLPSYALIDQNLQAGNPVIVRIKLHNGTTHFVVVVGKDGWDYLIRDPARLPTYGVYPLKEIVDHIEGLRFFRVVPPTFPPPTVATTPPLPPVAPFPIQGQTAVTPSPQSP